MQRLKKLATAGTAALAVACGAVTPAGATDLGFPSGLYDSSVTYVFSGLCFNCTTQPAVNAVLTLQNYQLGSAVDLGSVVSFSYNGQVLLDQSKISDYDETSAEIAKTQGKLDAANGKLGTDSDRAAQLNKVRDAAHRALSKAQDEATKAGEVVANYEKEIAVQAKLVVEQEKKVALLEKNGAGGDLEAARKVLAKEQAQLASLEHKRDALEPLYESAKKKVAFDQDAADRADKDALVAGEQVRVDQKQVAALQKALDAIKRSQVQLSISGSFAPAVQQTANVAVSAGADSFYSLLGGFFGSNVTGEGSAIGFAGLWTTTNEVRAQAAPSDVPEPATWAMMALGFGAAGLGMRRARRMRPFMG